MRILCNVTSDSAGTCAVWANDKSVAAAVVAVTAVAEGPDLCALVNVVAGSSMFAGYRPSAGGKCSE
jgi:hypothetical protein